MKIKGVLLNTTPGHPFLKKMVLVIDIFYALLARREEDIHHEIQSVFPLL